MSWAASDINLTFLFCRGDANTQVLQAINYFLFSLAVRTRYKQRKYDFLEKIYPLIKKRSLRFLILFIKIKAE